jgi:hypothetical protein
MRKYLKSLVDITNGEEQSPNKGGLLIKTFTRISIYVNLISGIVVSIKKEIKSKKSVRTLQ